MYENKDESIDRINRLQGRGHFQKNLRAEIIKSIEEDTPRSVIVYQYGVSRSIKMFEVCNFEYHMPVGTLSN